MSTLSRRRPDYNPDALREGIGQLDTNIDRLQKTIDSLRQQNDQMRLSMNKNNEDIRVFTSEIGKLEGQKAELSRLIAQIERERSGHRV